MPIDQMSYFSLKLFFDFLAAIILLFLATPLILLLMIISGVVLLELPLFFHQRIGKEGVEFKMIKIKTMKTGKGDGSKNPVLKGIRRSSLDELPQLINVLMGQMSFVGPRPLPSEYGPLIKPRHQLRNKILPGITGLSQVSGANELSWNDRFELDIKYVNEFSFKLDLSILLKTFLVIFKRKKDTSTALIKDY